MILPNGQSVSIDQAIVYCEMLKAIGYTIMVMRVRYPETGETAQIFVLPLGMN